MALLRCPHCARDFVRRVARTGLSEVLMSFIYIYPFKCQLCGDRFRSLQWGVRYVRVDEDRREYDRMEMRFPVTFSGQGIRGEGELLNVSMGGCSFHTGANLTTGMILKLELRISNDVAPVIVDAALVRNVRSGGVGVEFLQWQQSERERLQLLIRGLLIGRGVESDQFASPSETSSPR
jgi:PilZ domain